MSRRPAAGKGYAADQEHLWDALARIDTLVRAQVLRWRLTVAASKTASMWGMAQVSEEEIDAYLRASFLPVDRLPVELMHQLAPFWSAAEAAEAAHQERLGHTPPGTDLRLYRLVEALELSPLERDAMLVVLLAELDDRYGRLFGYVMDDASRRRPTVGLVQQILFPIASPLAEAWRMFAPDRPLHRYAILRSSPEGGDPLVHRTLSLDPRIVEFLLGGDAPDSRLSRILTPAPAELALDDMLLEPGLRDRLARLPELDREDGAAPLAVLRGHAGSGRRTAAAAAWAAAGANLLVADAQAALASPLGVQTIVDLVYREARLERAAVYWDHADAVLEGERTADGALLLEAAEPPPAMTLLAIEPPAEPKIRPKSRSVLTFEVTPPGYEQRRELWRSALSRVRLAGAGLEDAAASLANAFQLTPGDVHSAVALARTAAAQRGTGAEEPIPLETLFSACRQQAGALLSQLAQRLSPPPDQGWEDLVLNEATRRHLDELRMRIALRGELVSGTGLDRKTSGAHGLTVLFAGASGTGKTMAATLLSGEFGMDVYRIDLAGMVSKFIGETEKNLARAFLEAERCNAMLFFDEADALFGKRGEVSDARDRWANLEVDFLLQRIETHPGVVILATNLRQNIDPAFLRRIQLIVEFPFPDAKARAAIWTGAIPKKMKRPPDEVVAELAKRFPLTGGAIRNVVVDAAYRALAEDRRAPRLSDRHLAQALSREFQKQGLPIRRDQWGERLLALAEADGEP